VSRWTPCKRGDFIPRLRGLGFDGPFSGGRHQFMVFGQKRLAIPTNPEYSVPQLRILLREVEGILSRAVTIMEWIVAAAPSFAGIGEGSDRGLELGEVTGIVQASRELSLGQVARWKAF